MDTICLILSLFWLVVLVRVLMSWVQITPGTPVASIYSVVFRITEPVLGPLRRAIPPMRLGAGAIDLSPILVIVFIIIIC